MNIENLKKLSEFLRKIPEKNFNHNSWKEILDSPSHDENFKINDQNICGTSACVAGWAVVLSNSTPMHIEKGQITFTECPTGFGPTWAFFEKLASEWLELDRDQSKILFYPWDEVTDAWGKYDDDSCMYEYEQYFDSDTTNKEAADFLDLMILHNECKDEWWIDVKKERLG